MRFSLAVKSLCISALFLSFASAEWAAGKRGIVDFQFFTPDMSGTDLYPVVLYLHPNGWQGNIDQGGGVNPYLNNVHKDSLPSVLSTSASQSEHPCFILAPECPITNSPNLQWNYWVHFSDALGNVGWGPETYRVDDSANIKQDMTRAHDAYAILDSLIAQNPRIDTNRIYIAGGSMGGYGTFFLICAHPQKFACAVALAGAGDPSRADLIKDLPIWIFWGDQDGICPPDGSQNMVDAITAAGGEPNFLKFEGAGHIWNQVWDYTDNTFYQPGLIGWMFDQIKSGTTASPRDLRGSARNQSSDWARMSVRGERIFFSSPRPITVTLHNPQGQTIGRHELLQRESAGFEVPSGAGIVHARLSDGVRTAVESVCTGR